MFWTVWFDEILESVSGIVKTKKIIYHKDHHFWISIGYYITIASPWNENLEQITVFRKKKFLKKVNCNDLKWNWKNFCLSLHLIIAMETMRNVNIRWFNEGCENVNLTFILYYLVSKHACERFWDVKHHCSLRCFNKI